MNLKQYNNQGLKKDKKRSMTNTALIRVSLVVISLKRGTKESFIIFVRFKTGRISNKHSVVLEIVLRGEKKTKAFTELKIRE